MTGSEKQESMGSSLGLNQHFYFCKSERKTIGPPLGSFWRFWSADVSNKVHPFDFEQKQSDLPEYRATLCFSAQFNSQKTSKKVLSKIIFLFFLNFVQVSGDENCFPSHKCDIIEIFWSCRTAESFLNNCEKDLRYFLEL